MQAIIERILDLLVTTEAQFIIADLGNIDSALNQTSRVVNNNIQYQFIDSTHNIFLDFWVQGGVLGVIGLTVLIVYACRNLLKRNQVRELLILLGLLVVLSFNPMSIAIVIFFWWTLGQGQNPHSS